MHRIRRGRFRQRRNWLAARHIITATAFAYALLGPGPLEANLNNPDEPYFVGKILGPQVVSSVYCVSWPDAVELTRYYAGLSTKIPLDMTDSQFDIFIDKNTSCRTVRMNPPHRVVDILFMSELANLIKVVSTDGNDYAAWIIVENPVIGQAEGSKQHLIGHPNFHTDPSIRRTLGLR